MPVPDMPGWWWSESGYRIPGGCENGSASRTGERVTERLLVAKELIESKCVHMLKQSQAPIAQPEVHTYIHQEVKAYVTVSNQEMSEIVDALVHKGYIARDKEGCLLYTWDDMD